jgi:hypothetical protein
VLVGQDGVLEPGLADEQPDEHSQDGADEREHDEGTHSDEIQEIPNVGRFTYVNDTEGNVFGLMESQAGAQ